MTAWNKIKGVNLLIDTTYSGIMAQLEARERDSRRDASEYADSGDNLQSMYQDGRADGFREALALLRASEKKTYLDTKDRFIG